jgi:hypothetical protein
MENVGNILWSFGMFYIRPFGTYILWNIFIPKILMWYIWEALGMKIVGIFNGFGKFYGHWQYFLGHLVCICILWPFGIFCGHLVYFVAI